MLSLIASHNFQISSAVFPKFDINLFLQFAYWEFFPDLNDELYSSSYHLILVIIGLHLPSV